MTSRNGWDYGYLSEAEKEWLADDNWLCADCGIHTGLAWEYFMLKNKLWNEYGVGDGMLCVLCFESRLGRTLSKQDFAKVPLNGILGQYPKSDRLLARLGLLNTNGDRS